MAFFGRTVFAFSIWMTCPWTTLDKAFYANREYGKGLADNLSEELKSKPNRLQVTESIAKVLAHVQTEVRIDEHWFVSVVRARALGGRRIVGQNRSRGFGGAQRAT